MSYPFGTNIQKNKALTILKQRLFSFPHSIIYKRSLFAHHTQRMRKRSANLSIFSQIIIKFVKKIQFFNEMVKKKQKKFTKMSFKFQFET